MKKPSADLKRIKREIDDCLENLQYMNVFFPYRAIRNPTWEELEDYATEAYALALEDVLSAMDGDFKGLQEASSLNGRFLVRYSDRDIFIEHLKEEREQLQAELGEYQKAD
jgi:hypothetical protein